MFLFPFTPIFLEDPPWTPILEKGIREDMQGRIIASQTVNFKMDFEGPSRNNSLKDKTWTSKLVILSTKIQILS